MGRAYDWGPASRALSRSVAVRRTPALCVSLELKARKKSLAGNLLVRWSWLPKAKGGQRRLLQVLFSQPYPWLMMVGKHTPRSAVDACQPAPWPAQLSSPQTGRVALSHTLQLPLTDNALLCGPGPLHLTQLEGAEAPPPV